MRIATCKKVKTWLLSALIFLGAALCAVLCLQFNAPVQTHAEEATVNRTLQSGEYQTNGASMRVFKQTPSGNFEETEDKGIRFHVEMGSGYKYGTTTLFVEEETNKNERGAWVIAEGFKTYTLILPTRLLPTGEDLTVNTPKVMKLDTTEYWYTDKNGNVESVAYLYDIPAKWYTDTFSFKGIICDSNDNVLVETETSERCLSYVAKMSYKDTVNPSTVTWGTAERDDKAAPMIKEFVPTYTIKYVVNDVETEEEVLWGDTPQSVPTFDVVTNDHISYTASWYDQDNQEEIDIKSAMTWDENKTITLVQASSTDFILTGVTDYNNFVPGNGDNATYSGAKLYATLPTTDFFTTEEIKSGTQAMIPVSVSKDAITYQGTGTFNGLQGAWAMLEGAGGGAQMRLALAFDSSTMKNGDELILQEGAAFYANNIMYTLSESYTIDYSVVNDVEDYGVFLGYIKNADIKMIENWDEYGDGTRLRIRVTFHDDLLINSDFQFKFDGELPEGYTYPVYTKCNDTGTETEITKGYYYWNEGANTILELEGYAYHNNDELYGAPGTMVVQNGGYYIFEDAMYSYFNGTEWVVGKEKGTFGANAFETKGKNFSAGTQEIRFTTNANTTLTAGGTTNRWFDQVRVLDIENMSDEPYAVYATKPNGTVTPIESCMYHGQADANATDGYNHIFAFRGYVGSEAGETITIVKGTRFWYGSEYYTATEEIIFYFNGLNWLSANDGTADQEITAADFAGKNYNYFEANTNKLRMHLTADSFNAQTGPLYLESGSVKVNGKAYTNLHYHGSGNKIFEIIGDSLAPIGQDAFEYTLVIEEGTKIWMGVAGAQTPYCIEFTETLEWRYVGENLRDGSGNKLSYHWIMPNNVDVTATDITTMYNDTGAGGEVRLGLSDGILTNDYYGFMSVDVSKGIPIVNGVEMPNHSFAYNQGNDLVAIRGGEYGTKLGDYLIIPAGSMWWTTQGSLTFVDEIVGVYNGGEWFFGFNTENQLDTLAVADVQRVYNEGTNEIRVKVPLDTAADSYYGPMAIRGDAYVTKADGTVVNSVYGYWYGGESGTYEADHSLIGFQGLDIIGATDGDVLTVKAGTKLSFRTALGADGYVTFDKDLAYTFMNGSWQTGDFRGTVAYSGTNASVSGETEVLQGQTYSFTATPNSGYAITSVIVNGDSLDLTNDNVYSFTAISGENKVFVTAKKLYAVTWSNPTGATITVSANGSAISSGATVVEGTVLTVSVAASTGYNVTGITANGTAVANGGTYKVNGETTIAATTAEKTKYTVSWTNPTGATITVSANETGTVTSGVTAVYAGQTLTVTVAANNDYRLNTVTIGGTAQNGVSTARNGSFTGNYQVSGNTTIAVTTVKMYAVSWTVPTGTFSTELATITVKNGSTTLSSGNYVDKGTTIAVTVATKNGSTISTGGSISDGVTTTAINAAGNYSHVVNGTTTITVKAESGSCIVEGTMILMADGTQKAVEDLQIGDMLMVFDHFSGQYVARPFIMDVHAAAAAKQYNVLNMTFSNGAIWRIVGHHTIFDTTLNQYVTISQSNVDQYVGHTFYYTDGIVSENVTMTGYYMTEEVVKVFSPTTYEFANYFANGFLNAPPLPDTMTAGQMNCFDFDENMQYVNVEADIEKYGLYTYEDFADYISEDVFNALPFKYFKVSVGKGLLTWDEIVGLISMV